MSQLRTLPLKSSTPKADDPVQVTFMVTVLTRQENPVLRIQAAHFVQDLDSDSLYFFRESQAVCQATKNKTGSYPTPVAMFKNRDVLSVVKSGVSAGRLDVDGWLAAFTSANGSMTVVPTEQLLEMIRASEEFK